MAISKEYDETCPLHVRKLTEMIMIRESMTRKDDTYKHKKAVLVYEELEADLAHFFSPRLRRSKSSLNISRITWQTVDL